MKFSDYRQLEQPLIVRFARDPYEQFKSVRVPVHHPWRYAVGARDGWAKS